MNALERLLQDELDRLIDRMAATTHEGLMAACGQRRPDLLQQLADSEARLTTARDRLLQAYEAWRDALDECSDLWALADLATASTVGGDRRAA